MRLSLSLALAAVSVAAPALAQTATATPAAAFLYAVEKVCTPNVMGKLSFAGPAAALDAAQVLLVDGASDPDTRAAFHDMSPVHINYAAVTSASGQITLASDETEGTCRVAALLVTAADVAAIQAGTSAIDGDWNPTANDAAAGQTSYSGTIAGNAVMVQVTVPPTGSHWGPDTGIFFTVMNPAAGQ